MTMDSAGSGRRQFFREAFGELVRPLAAYLEDKLPVAPGRPFLRPPGAVEETKFLDTCYRCGTCVAVCPVKAISLRHAPGHPANGSPGIDPDVAACVLCPGLTCTNSCPSGALRPLKRAYEVRMGLARVVEAHCLRTKGQDCTACVERCPIGRAAISFPDAGPPKVSSSGCVGCGLCQSTCPTRPKAILVKPLQPEAGPGG